MPLPLTVSCFSKIQIGFTFLVPVHLGSPGKRAVKRVCVCVLSRYLSILCLWRVHSRVALCVDGRLLFPVHRPAVDHEAADATQRQGARYQAADETRQARCTRSARPMYVPTDCLTSLFKHRRQRAEANYMLV